MFDMLLQIDFTNLASPEVFDSSLAFLISIMLGTIMWAAVRLRSPAVFAVWTITVMALILSFIIGLPFIWFWVLMLLNVIVISVAASVQYLF